MIFRAESAQKIIEGRKTVTRRLARSVCKYRVGQDYSVQPGRGQREVARILVTSIRREPLGGALERGELRAEGFGQAAPSAFVKLWMELHDGSWDPNLKVDRIEFELVSA